MTVPPNRDMSYPGSRRLPFFAVLFSFFIKDTSPTTLLLVSFLCYWCFVNSVDARRSTVYLFVCCTVPVHPNFYTARIIYYVDLLRTALSPSYPAVFVAGLFLTLDFTAFFRRKRKESITYSRRYYCTIHTRHVSSLSLSSVIIFDSLFLLNKYSTLRRTSCCVR